MHHKKQESTPRLISGMHLVWISPGDEWKTAFRTCYSSFKWLVMPEGLTNAPATFQRFMNDIFVDMIDVMVIIYLDDILIYSNNISKHILHVKEVLCRLHANGLFACADKCKFHVTSCEYLRYMLSPEGLTMAPYKVQIIQDWPEPRKVKDIQSFLGFTNFYCHFIFGYSKITVPLTHLTCKGTPWHFTDECHSAFEALKKAFTTALVLTHWIPDTQITVETDASDYALAAVLSITTSNGELCSTPRPFPLQNSNMTSTTKSSSRFLKLSNDDDITSKALDFRSTWSLITGTCNTFQQPKSSHVGKHNGPNTFPDSTSSFVSPPESSEPNPMHSLDDGMSTLKRGIATMPVLIHRTTARYSLPSNWHHPSKLPPYQSQSSMDLSSWMLKGSIPTSNLNSEMIPFPQNTSTISQTLSGLDPDGLLHHLRHIYVLNSGNLQLHVLQYSHDHPLAGHFGQTKTLHQVHMQYYWSRLQVYVKDY